MQTAGGGQAGSAAARAAGPGEWAAAGHICACLIKSSALACREPASPGKAARPTREQRITPPHAPTGRVGRRASPPGAPHRRWRANSCPARCAHPRAHPATLQPCPPAFGAGCQGLEGSGMGVPNVSRSTGIGSLPLWGPLAYASCRHVSSALSLPGFPKTVASLSPCQPNPGHLSKL